MSRIGSVVVLLLLVGCQDLSQTGNQDKARLDRIAETYDRGDLASAVPELQSYVKDYPGDPLAWTILGNALEDKDRLDEAEAAYQKALAANPQQFEAITGMGIIYRKRGDYDAAMKAYEHAVAIDPGYAQAYSSMTTIALKKYDDKKALEYAEKAYDLDKTDPVIAANLAIAYHYNGDASNRDKITTVAEQLGYANVEKLRKIFTGELTIRD